MELQQETERAAEMLAGSQHAVVLTGAGHSTPSGIPDFRSPDSGLWEQVDPMEVASIYGFQRNPKSFYDWIRPLAKQMMEAQPNPAHYALAELEEMGVLKAVITQNIDELHHRAGSKRVLELHGSVRTATCTRCLEHLPTGEMWPAFVASAQVPHCPHCGGLLKPDVVLFGELLPVHVLEEAQQESERCDVMLVAGSSLEVYPAADLPLRAVQAGAQAIIVNYEPTYMDARAAVVIHEDVAVILPQIAAQVKRLKGERLTASL
jgi:NAD-dependent deacetylase